MQFAQLSQNVTSSFVFTNTFFLSYIPPLFFVSVHLKHYQHFLMLFILLSRLNVILTTLSVKNSVSARLLTRSNWNKEANKQTKNRVANQKQRNKQTKNKESVIWGKKENINPKTMKKISFLILFSISGLNTTFAQLRQWFYIFLTHVVASWWRRGDEW